MAAYHGQGKLIDLLIQSGAVVDATDYLGLTPLHLACQRGFQNVMVYKHVAKGTLLTRCLNRALESEGLITIHAGLIPENTN